MDQTNLVPVEMTLARWGELLDILYKVADMTGKTAEDAELFIAEIEDQTGML
jgi:hypothetical protein